MTMTTTTITTTSLGKLQGSVDNRVVAFRGIRYAQPPLGPLRFAPSVRPNVVRSTERRAIRPGAHAAGEPGAG
jgi:carboxylesterase type B